MQPQQQLSRRQFSLLAASVALAPDAPTESLPAERVENFLAQAKVVSSKFLGVGITGTRRLTLSEGNLTHDAHFQTIDESKASFQTPRGNELNFRDTYKFNIAGYRLDRLLGLNMVPPSIERPYGGNTGSFTWWIPAALMEVDRSKRKILPPDIGLFNNQMFVLRVFDQLIFNTDRNLQNLLLTPDCKLWLIDHTRAFRLHHDIRSAKDLEKCDRRLLVALRKLETSTLKAAMNGVLRNIEIEALLKRRDKIVAEFDKKIAALGESQVMFDLPARAAEYPVDYAVNPWRSAARVRTRPMLS